MTSKLCALEGKELTQAWSVNTIISRLHSSNTELDKTMREECIVHTEQKAVHVKDDVCDRLQRHVLTPLESSATSSQSQMYEEMNGQPETHLKDNHNLTPGSEDICNPALCLRNSLLSACSWEYK